MSDFRFEDLNVYQKTLDVIDKVYKLTERFPKDEVFGLTSQLKRASVSIALNIGEGSGSSDKNFNKYLGISRDSLKECIVCLTISRRREFITEKDNNELRNEISRIVRHRRA